MSPVRTKTSDRPVSQLIDVIQVLVRHLSTRSAAGLPRSSVASRRPSARSDSGTAHTVPDVDPGNVTIAPLDSLLWRASPCDQQGMETLPCRSRRPPDGPDRPRPESSPTPRREK